jgi:hypothetical protein
MVDHLEDVRALRGGAAISYAKRAKRAKRAKNTKRAKVSREAGLRLLSNGLCMGDLLRLRRGAAAKRWGL